VGSTSIAVGDIIGSRYCIESVLGQGGMAIVYRARNTGTGKACALKIVHPHLVTKPELVEMFVREAQVAGRIGDSPYVVNVFDAGVDEDRGVPFMAMELLKGETLDAYVESRGPMPRTMVRTLFDQLADALDQAHRAGVIHRDLKPSNLFVTQDRRGRPVLKIMDFGIAKVLEHGAAFRRLAAKHGVTIAQGVSPATDVWALGLVAFELLTGLPKGHYWATLESLDDILIKVSMEEHEPASVRAGDRAALLPEGFDEWFARCLRKNAAERWQTPGEAVNELRRLLAPTTLEIDATQPLSDGGPTLPADFLKRAEEKEAGAKGAGAKGAGAKGAGGRGAGANGGDRGAGDKSAGDKDAGDKDAGDRASEDRISVSHAAASVQIPSTRKSGLGSAHSAEEVADTEPDGGGPRPMAQSLLPVLHVRGEPLIPVMSGSAQVDGEPSPLQTRSTWTRTGTWPRRSKVALVIGCAAFAAVVIGFLLRPKSASMGEGSSTAVSSLSGDPSPPSPADATDRAAPTAAPEPTVTADAEPAGSGAASAQPSSTASAEADAASSASASAKPASSKGSKTKRKTTKKAVGVPSIAGVASAITRRVKPPPPSGADAPDAGAGSGDAGRIFD
jgi:hypothetical protein